MVGNITYIIAEDGLMDIMLPGYTTTFGECTISNYKITNADGSEFTSNYLSFAYPHLVINTSNDADNGTKSLFYTGYLSNGKASY